MTRAGVNAPCVTWRWGGAERSGGQYAPDCGGGRVCVSVRGGAAGVPRLPTFLPTFPHTSAVYLTCPHSFLPGGGALAGAAVASL